MPAKRDHTQIGFTLIEAMITLFVIAVGLLGIAGLTAFGIGASHTAYMRSIASIHSENMAEMMRANVAGADANDYADLDYGNISDGDDCRSSNCTPSQQATANARFWIQAIEDSLPSGAGQVVCEDSAAGDGDTCTDGSSHTITVGWTEKESGQTKQFTTVFRP